MSRSSSSRQDASTWTDHSVSLSCSISYGSDKQRVSIHPRYSRMSFICSHSSTSKSYIADSTPDGTRAQIYSRFGGIMMLVSLPLFSISHISVAEVLSPLSSPRA